jgi:localization factor PodJL
MSSSVPWSVKGIDRKARETAKDLARRSGMTLGEWLNHVIEYQGEGKVTPLPQNATLTESIERLTQRIEAVETRSSLAVTGIDQSVRGLASRIDAAETLKPGAAGAADVAGAIKSLEASLARIATQVHENEAAQKASLGEIRDELARVSRRIEAGEGGGGTASDKRLSAMEAQIRKAEQRSTKAIEGIGQQVLLMADTVQRQVEGIDTRTGAAIERVEADVARVAEQIDGRLKLADEAQATALEKLGAEIERITTQLSQRISQAAPSAETAWTEDTDFAGSIFGNRIRQSEARTAALLDEARETVEQRLEEIQPPAQATVEADQAAQVIDDLAPADEAEEDEFVQPSAPTESLDPFAMDEDPFAGAAAPAAANTDLSPAPVIFPSQDEMRADFAFAPQDFTPVEPDAVEESEGQSEAEADTFGKVEFGAADPFTVDDEFVTTEPLRADPFAIEADADEADVFEARDAEPHVETVDDEALAIEPEGEAFEPGPFGRREEPADDLARSEEDEGARAHREPEAAFEPQDEPVDQPDSHEQLSYLERARMAAREASKGDQKAGGRGGFSLGAFGFGGARRRGGAKLKNGLLMSTAVLICLGSGLAGAAMLAPLLKQSGAKLNEKQPLEAPPSQPQAAMMTNPQPIATTASATGASVVAEAAPAKPADPNASLIYAESLSLLSAKDPKGVEMLRKAADLGYPQAELQLGHLYETGFAGLRSDLAQARKWTQKAAEAGLPSAMHNLAMLVYNGEGGPKSPALAAQWFRQAAELGQVDSQFNLGLLYENGKGVQANPAEAYKWFLLASRGGDAGARAEARAAAQRVRPLISAEAQAAADRAAASYGVTQQAAK